MKHRNIAIVATAILAMNAAHVGACSDSCKPLYGTPSNDKCRLVNTRADGMMVYEVTRPNGDKYTLERPGGTIKKKRQSPVKLWD